MAVPAEQTILESRRSPWRVVGRVAIIVMVLGLTAMWLYAFFGHFDVPGRLADQTFPHAAEPVCQAATGRLAKLPRAKDAANAASRADVIDQSDDILTTMTTDLRGKVPATDPVRTEVTEWLDDWQRYVADRREFAATLRTDPDARFYVTKSDRDKSQITNAIDNFAKANDMASCATPDDLS